MDHRQLITGKTYKGICQDLAIDGSGIVRTDGKVVFVKDLLPGEEAEIKITGEKKNIFYGEIVGLTKASPERTVPGCPYYGICGGCSISHASYRMQLDFKEKHVNDCLSRIAGTDAKVQGRIFDSSRQYGYRNKISLPARMIDGATRLCMTSAGGGRSVPIKACLLVDDKMNHLISKVQEWIELEKIKGYDPLRYKGLLRRVVIRKAQGRYLINFILNSDSITGQEFLKELFKDTDYLSGITWSVNRKKTDDSIVEMTYTLCGEPTLSETYNGILVDISSESFSQVNKEIAEKMYAKAVELASSSDKDKVLDLYCGTGSMTLQLARHCEDVIGVEVVDSAVKDAKRNAKRNGIHNATFICSPVEKLIDDNRFSDVDVIVLDPPRKGCDAKTIDSIKAIGPDRIVYISCNPSTLARDIRTLGDSYEIREVHMCDMFSQTMHVETVCCLYHQKKDFISAPFEPKNADYLNQGK